jgi:hypothetical protein
VSSCLVSRLAPELQYCSRSSQQSIGSLEGFELYHRVQLTAIAETTARGTSRTLAERQLLANSVEQLGNGQFYRD